MPKFNVQADFSLTTTIEFDGYLPFENTDEAIDYSDSSYFGSTEVESDGGSVSFKVEAEDEADAQIQAEIVVTDGYEVEDSSGITWLVSDVSFTIERDEMSRDEAFVIVRRLLDRLTNENVITSEEREALDLVIQDS